MVTHAELLVDKLDQDLAQRRRELIDLRLMLSSATGTRLSMLARTSQVMAYAHWEGFVKHSLRAYLDYIGLLKLSLGDLRLELQALALRASIRVAVTPERDIGSTAQLLADLDSRSRDAFAIDTAEVVRTGNMTAETLESLLGCAGLDFEAVYEARQNYIDSVICGRRHRVAHGSWQPVTKDEARDLLADVMMLCSEVNDQIQTAVVYEHYLLKRQKATAAARIV